MQTATVRDLRPLAVVALLGLIGGCVLFGSRQPPDENLVRLVDRLSMQLAGSTVLASSIVSAAAILAAVIIPAITVLCLLRGTGGPAQRPPGKRERHTKHAIDGHDTTRALPENSPGNEVIMNSSREIVEQRSTISSPHRSRHGAAR